MPLSADERYLAENCYGYGNWDAPYWFIGPEQGVGQNETDFAKRVTTFHKQSRDGLCDLCAFHRAIDQGEYCRDENPVLQRTWKVPILLLMAFKGETNPSDTTLRKEYQRDHLGRTDGETLLAELSGLPSRSQGVSRNDESYDKRRIEKITEKLGSPKLVVMYGASKKEIWKAIAGLDLEIDVPQKKGATVFLFIKHPNTRGRTNEEWMEIGEKSRREYLRS